MKRIIAIIICFIGFVSFSQENDSIPIYKKRVLESTEVDYLMSYYKQDGTHSSVGGGIGTENLTDYTPTVVVSVPLSDDDVLTVDVGISAYTSASSSNLNPFDASGASQGYEEENDDKRKRASMPLGSPWIASSGASKSDVWSNITMNYSRSSDDRNNIWNAHASFSIEYDYFSIGFGGGFTKQFNNKNTTLGISGNVYLDTWKPLYPTELEEFAVYGANFQNQGYFQGVDVWNQNGTVSNAYNPQGFTEFENQGRNSYAISLSFSQIVNKSFQISLFGDLLFQQGLLSTPYHRVYFADQPNFYIGGNANAIANYTSSSNTEVFHLADDNEQLPDTRWKIPIGVRANYYINEILSLRSYYRFYTDNWGVMAHTASLELPIKFVGGKFTLLPTYRFYSQQQANYFAPYETHLSTSEFYTSDYDLSTFDSHQYGVGLRYTDIFTKFKVFKFGLKNMELRYNRYDRSDGLQANIFSTGFKFVLD
ncbi:DUF3570 domain-containing protein [Aquimarina sp. 2201CG5-10]|uniref:DUF3570 domain-containing protein n=1 Tax=Aquimarina callyspongiae TaxID=3098150 RepID=UPI002AB3DC07|nr:DUF3570 domain-containing protein [Aquimarina sp. 2201CG5-10]MDY8134888.1 DUF3570 domain-containing protein [Aquimarina sp. 2201CG5-10]